MKTQKLAHKTELKIFSEESALCYKTGFLVAASLIGFFFLMKAIGFYEILGLRYLNVIFLLTGIIIAFSSYRSKKESDNEIDYLTGLKMGMHITFAAAIPFAIFMAIYLNIDKNFMIYIQQNAMFGEYLSPLSAAVATLLEGAASGVIITFMVMQYFKKNS